MPALPVWFPLETTGADEGFGLFSRRSRNQRSEDTSTASAIRKVQDKRVERFCGREFGSGCIMSSHGRDTVTLIFVFRLFRRIAHRGLMPMSAADRRIFIKNTYFYGHSRTERRLSKNPEGKILVDSYAF